MTKKAFLMTALFLGTLSLVNGHSFLLEPSTEAKENGLRECRIGGPEGSNKNNCTGPCISVSWMLREDPKVTTYKRGQDATMVWARNNHQGGFVRFALVPFKDRMNADAHDKFAFHFACYDAGLHPCPRPDEDDEYCGTEKRLHRTNVTIPKVYPNGKYILGWAWFGGVAKKSAWFGDYWSCSHIEIKGGPFEDSYKPTFSPDEKKQGCYSGVNKLGVCPKEPCKNGQSLKATEMLPDGFSKDENGNFVSSSEINRSDLDANHKPSVKPTTPPSPTSSPPNESRSSSKAEITRLELVEIGDEIKSITADFKKPINLKQYGPVTLHAITTGKFSRLEFYIDGARRRTEYVKPYVLTGNIGQQYNRWIPPMNKWIQISVKGYTKDGRLRTKSISVKFVSK